MSLPSQSQPIPIGYEKPGPFVVIRTCWTGDGDSGEYCTGMSQGGWWVNTNMYVFGFGTLDEEMHFLRPWNSFLYSKLLSSMWQTKGRFGIVGIFITSFGVSNYFNDLFAYR